MRERYGAVRVSDGHRALLNLFPEGSAPDPAIYDVVRRLPRDHVPEIIAIGRWGERGQALT
jgi:primosomal replication protein N''